MTLLKDLEIYKLNKISLKIPNIFKSLYIDKMLVTHSCPIILYLFHAFI